MADPAHSDDSLCIADPVAHGHVFGLVWRALRRHAKPALQVFALCTLVGFVASSGMPKSYRVVSRVLVRSNGAIAALANPDRGRIEEEKPGGGLVEALRSRETLLLISNDIKLPSIWAESRAPWLRAKDWVRERVLGPLSPDQLNDIFAKMLHDRISAGLEGEVVVLQVDWNDPKTALRVAEATVGRFLKQRHDVELAQILEPSIILEQKVESSRASIAAAVQRMQRVFATKEHTLRAEHSAPAERSHTVTVAKPEAAYDPRADYLRGTLAQKQGQLVSAKRAYEGALKKAQERLAQLEHDLGPKHPDLVEARRQVDILSRPPSELAKMQDETATLLAQAGTIIEPHNPASPPPSPPVRVDAPPSDDGEDDVIRLRISSALYRALDKDPELASIMKEVRRLQGAHHELVMRLAGARLERDAANAAFELRYLVTLPPIKPHGTSKPLGLMCAAGGFVAGLVLAFVTAIWVELRAGRITEAWQIERFLHARFLGEVEG